MKYLAGAAVLALMLCACGANHGAQNVLPMQAAEPAQAQSSMVAMPEPATAATAKLVIRVPAAASSSKSVWVSVNGGAPVSANLSNTSAGCVAPTSTQPLTCTVSVSAPAATDVFTVKTFNASNGGGTVVASATLLQPVAGTGATLPLTLAGTVAGLSVQLGRTSATECAPAFSTPVYIRAKDAQGNVIVSSNYGVAVSLRDSDTSGATKLSSTSVNASSTAITLNYNGNKAGLGATFSASAPGVASSASTPATLSFAQQLYVLDANNQYVQVYSPTANGNVAPSRILNERGRMTSQARQIWISNTCTLYAADGGNNTIFAFPAGATGSVAPTAMLSGSATMLNGPQGVATDTSGKIYAPIFSSSQHTGGVGIWNAGSNGNVAPAATIIGANTQVGHPGALAFDGSGNLYVLDFRKVVVFAKGATGNATPLRVLLTPALYCESGMTVDPSGKIYITDCSNTINVYAAGASGNAAAVQVINTGASTGPTGAAIDRSGNIFTTLQRIPAVASYASTANGTATPLTNISGSSTTLNYPFDVTF